MSTHSEWRVDLARRLAPAYIENPQVAALVVYGSSVLGLSDRYSDVEMCAFWHDTPKDSERKAAIERAGGELWRFFGYDEEHGDWGEEYGIQDVRIDMSHRTVSEVEERLDDVVMRYSISSANQNLASLVLNCIPLHGSTLIERWRKKVKPYPDGLQRAMLSEHLAFKFNWWREVLAERGDLLPLYTNLCGTERQLLLVLMALNRVYLPHQAFKWSEQLANGLAIAPHLLGFRLKRVLRAEPDNAVKELAALLEETFSLVEQHVPGIDVDSYRDQFRSRRAAFDEVPYK